MTGWRQAQAARRSRTRRPGSIRLATYLGARGALQQGPVLRAGACMVGHHRDEANNHSDAQYAKNFGGSGAEPLKINSSRGATHPVQASSTNSGRLHAGMVATSEATSILTSTVLDADISACFDEMDHSVVMSFVRARIADGRVLDLFEAYLKAGVYEAGTVHVPERGFPQGGVISPWLMNLVLDDLDKAIESRGWRHVRYADDFLVLCHTRNEADQALAYVKEVLEALKLSLNVKKTRVSTFQQGFEFLGFRFRGSSLGIRPKAIDALKDKVRRLTRRQQGRNIDAVIKDLVPVLRGWARYFGVAEVTSTFAALDGWIRMRLRAFKFKRKNHNDNWRLPNRRLAKWGFLSLQQCRPTERLSLCGCADR